MKRAMAALAILAMAWAAWWPVAAWWQARATAAWLEERREAGWQAEWKDIAVTGFPLTYVRRIDGPALADPAAGWAWRAERVQLARPRHPALTQGGLVLTLPPEQSLQTPTRRVTLRSQSMRAELRLAGPADLVEAATIDLAEMRADSDTGWGISVAEARLAALASDAAPEVVTLTLTAQDVAPPAGALDALKDVDIAPGGISRVRAELRATFDRPWTRAALEGARPQPVEIVIEEAALDWGDLRLRATGTVRADAQGRAEGAIAVQATNWRAMLKAARTSGRLPDGLAGAVEGTLDLLGRLSGRSDTLDVSVRLADGLMRIGPLPVGPAPRLALP